MSASDCGADRTLTEVQSAILALGAHGGSATGSASITVREGARAVLALVLEPPGNDNRFALCFSWPSSIPSILPSGKFHALDHARVCWEITISLISAASTPLRKIARDGIIQKLVI